MASYLIVHVLRAEVPSSSNTSLNNFLVKLRFNGQNSTTSVKETIPVWGEKFCFSLKQRSDDPPGDLILRAEVYSSGSLLGTVLLSDAYFDRHSDNVAVIRRSWNDADPASPRINGGVLLLKVFLATADDLDILNTVFPTNDRYADENIVEQQSPIALQPADVVPKQISPNFEPGRVVERMHHLFVRVVRARKLPDVDANGSLDPYVEVKFGDYNKGVTKCLKRNKNPEWNVTFAFSFQHGKAPNTTVDVIVNDKDLVRDDFVGKLCFDVETIPERSPDDIPLEPTWYLLLDQGGNRLAHASLLVAVWIGSQADEAYRHSWVSQHSPKVYENPRLWCLRITIVQAQGITMANDNASTSTTEVYCKACLGKQIKTTRTAKMETTKRGSYIWNEDLVLVAAEPFFEDDLVVSVIASPGNDEVIGQVTVPLASIEKRTNIDDHLVTTQWFELKNPTVPQLLDGYVDDDIGNNQMKICLGKVLDGRYHIGPGSQSYTDDTRPADRKLWDSPIGLVDLGILRAIDLTCLNASDATSILNLNPYCVAKYGDKWVRTRTIDGPDHVFNEQYTWDVYDVTTVLNVAVFNHTQRDSRHHEIGKVRIHLSCLETDRIYAHSYPLVTLRPSGAIKTGELQLAVKISSTSSMNMLLRYSQPIFPWSHYVEPLPDTEQQLFSEREIDEVQICSQASEILALRLGQMEPPLRSEIVAFMCDSEVSSLFSLRKSKVNFNRLQIMVSPFFSRIYSVQRWSDPLDTLLAHAIFVLAVWFPKLLFSLVVLYAALVAVKNYQRRPTCPPHVDYALSYLGNVHRDELEEEFDTVKSSCGSEAIMRMRYDRLRHVGGRIQTVVGDIASCGERIQSLVSWSDPRATMIFEFIMLVATAVAYFVPFKILVTAAGFYFMRHPKLRAKPPSIIENFFRRLQSRGGEIM